MKKVKILNVQFDVCTLREALGRVSHLLSERRTEGAKQIVTPNPEMLLAAQKNADLRAVLNRAWLSIPDGIGILWASSLTGRVSRLKGIFSLLKVMLWPSSCRSIFPERVTGVDLMEAICKESRRFGSRIFLLGGYNGVPQKVQRILEHRYPGILIVGTSTQNPEADLAEIQKAKPDLLFVAYGCPTQELWIAKNLKQLPSVKIAMGIGGSFDFIAGVRKRAPVFMQRVGLEWLFRLIQEPRRFKRIYNAVVRFPQEILKNK